MIEVDVASAANGFPMRVRFTARDGITALFGPSGAGKSSVVRMIAGLAAPERGRIAVDGRALFDSERGIDLPPAERRVGVVFQHPGLFPHLSVRRNLTYANWAGRRARGFEFDYIVALLGIGHLLDRAPRTLSGGEAQRVAIGRALLADPAILLLDEPFSALDQGRREELMPFLESMRDALSVPMLYISHSMSEVTRLASTLVVLAHGEVVVAGEIGAVLAERDIGALAGLRMTGSLLAGIVSGFDAAYGLTHIDIGGESLVLAAAGYREGDRVRLRVSPRDVLVARSRPADLSARNVLAATVETVTGTGAPVAELTLRVAGQRLRAAITRHAIAELGLEAGTACYAIIKTMALEGRAVTDG